MMGSATSHRISWASPEDRLGGSGANRYLTQATRPPNTAYGVSALPRLSGEATTMQRSSMRGLVVVNLSSYRTERRGDPDQPLRHQSRQPSEGCRLSKGRWHRGG